MALFKYYEEEATNFEDYRELWIVDGSISRVVPSQETVSSTAVWHERVSPSACFSTCLGLANVSTSNVLRLNI